MAGRIAGITIEIGGDTTKLQSSLKGVDRQLRSTQSALKDINKLLKLDPGNTELLRQKQKQLAESIKLTKERLAELKAAQSQVAEGTPEWDALQREIIATEQELKSLEKEYRQFGSVGAQQIAAAGKKMEEFGNKVSSAGQKLMPLSRTAAGIGAGLLGLGYKAVTTADDLNTLSQQTGLTTEEIQKMQYASDLVDVSFDDISGALKKLKKNMTGHADTWEKLGISVTNADGSMRDATDVFYESLDALSKIENETERDQLAMDLFGKSADQLAGIIDDGGAALKEYGDEAKSLGLIMEQDTIDSLNEMNDVLDKLKKNFKGSFGKLGAAVAKAFGPSLEKASGLLETLAEKIRNISPEQAELIVKITGVVAAIAPLLIVGGKLISGIGKIMMLAPMISTAFSALLSPVGLVIAGIAAAIAIGVLLYKNWDKIKEKAAELKAKVVEAWNNLKTKTTEAWENLKQSTIEGWEATKQEVITAWETMKSNISQKVEEIKTKISETWETIKSNVSTKVESIKTTVVGKFNALKGTVSGIWTGIKTSITTAIETAKEKVKSAIDKIKGFFDFEVSWPHIPLPHFSITPAGWKLKDLLEGIVPSLSISWYKAAYDNPIMFTSPTVMATPGGMKGFGDGHGAEIVMGLNKLQELVGASSDVIINVYPTQGMDIYQLADQIQDRFVALQKQRSMANA